MSDKDQKKQIPLRLSQALWNELSAWAGDEFRSVNGQIEFLLTQCVNRRKSGAAYAANVGGTVDADVGGAVDAGETDGDSAAGETEIGAESDADGDLAAGETTGEANGDPAGGALDI